MCAKVCARYECATLRDPSCFMRPTALARPYTFFTFSSSGRRAKCDLMDEWTYRFSFFHICTLSIYKIIFVYYLGYIGGKLNIELAYFRAVHIRAISREFRVASRLSSRGKYIFASHRRCAISEKLIIHLCRRYVFPVDARCPFNAFATAGSMRGVLASTTLSLPPSFSSFSRDTSFLCWLETGYPI